MRPSASARIGSRSVLSGPTGTPSSRLEISQQVAALPGAGLQRRHQAAFLQDNSAILRVEQKMDLSIQRLQLQIVFSLVT